MDIATWIIMCMFACFGAVELFGRFFYGCRKVKGVNRGCLAVPIRNGGKLDRNLRYYLSYAQWNGLGRSIVFVAEEEDAEGREAFDKLFSGIAGFYFCTTSQLADFMRTVP